MPKQKKHSGVWQYLEASGVLLHGSPEEIAAARQAYWCAYRQKWNKQERKKYTIALNQKEHKELIQAAAKHHRKPTTFLKESAFCYMRSTYLTLDSASVQEIRILLARNYAALEALEEYQSESNFGIVLMRMEELEFEVLRILTNPPKNSSQE